MKSISRVNSLAGKGLILKRLVVWLDGLALFALRSEVTEDIFTKWAFDKSAKLYTKSVLKDQGFKVAPGHSQHSRFTGFKDV